MKAIGRFCATSRWWFMNSNLGQTNIRILFLLKTVVPLQGNFRLFSEEEEEELENCL